eukprot:TRINITY_DN49148_c0_g1_i1.p1 TRINITY_DN49148_c0_g1~~TRINITY_DN49148_c0_g1_i1.p1  ORF type:complete len:426 (+),score=51.01 TRINITY_DN49148_c0_g1_i1:49-1278(+)
MSDYFVLTLTVSLSVILGSSDANVPDLADCHVGSDSLGGSCKTQLRTESACDDSFWSYAASLADQPVTDIAAVLESWAVSSVEDCAILTRNSSWVFKLARRGLLEGASPASIALLLFRHSAVLAANHTWSSASRVLDEEVPCRRPKNVSAGWRQFDEELLALDLEPGRVCKGGWCPQRCGLLALDAAISNEEAGELITLGAEVLAKMTAQNGKPPEKTQIDLHLSAHHGNRSRHLLFLNVLERSRRLIATYVGVPPSWITFASHFLVKKDAGDKRSGEDGNEVHCDESSFDRFHFSGVLWLTTHGDGVGGELRFRAADGDEWRRELVPVAGRLALFSSGWENIHQVRKLHEGSRWALPLFASVVPPFNATRIAKACVHPSGTKQWNYCEDRMAQWLSAADSDFMSSSSH